MISSVPPIGVTAPSQRGAPSAMRYSVPAKIAAPTSIVIAGPRMVCISTSADFDAGLQLAADEFDMALPRINNWSFWILPCAFAILLSLAIEVVVFFARALDPSTRLIRLERATALAAELSVAAPESLAEVAAMSDLVFVCVSADADVRGVVAALIGPIHHRR